MEVQQAEQRGRCGSCVWRGLGWVGTQGVCAMAPDRGLYTLTPCSRMYFGPSIIGWRKR